MVVYIHVHFCHHCGALGHSHPNCYKWLATQQSNNVLSSGGHGHILQKPHVPFELERFQFFPFTFETKVQL